MRTTMGLSRRAAGTSVLVVLCLATWVGSLRSAPIVTRECLWVGDPATTITYTPWTTTSVGLIWDTQTRTCTQTWSGPAVWNTIRRERTCTPGIGISVGKGIGGTAGVEYPVTVTVLSTEMGDGSARRVSRQERCLWTSTTVIGLNETENVQYASFQSIVNGFDGATVTFDGLFIPLGAEIDFAQIAPGAHTMVVTRTDGILTDVITFEIDLVSSYVLSSAGSSHPVVPTGLMEFTNDSPDDITVFFTVMPLLQGLDAAVVVENWVTVGAFSSYQIPVEFYTQPGYVAEFGQELSARVDVRLGTPDGLVIASGVATAFAVPEPGSLCLLGLGGAGLIAIGLRRRGPAGMP